MITTTKLKMDIAAPNLPAHIWAKQGDANSRWAELELYENGIPWTIPSSAAAVIRYQSLPGGGGGIYDTCADGTAAWSVSGNRIRVALAPQMLAQAGGVLMDVALTEGEALLATCNIHIHVEGSPREGTALEQTDYCNLALVTAAYRTLSQALSAAAAGALTGLPAALDAWMEAHPESSALLRTGAVTPDKTSFIRYGEYRHPDAVAPTYVNQIPLSTDAAGEPLGWETDRTLSTYTGAATSLAGYDATGFIPLTGTGDVLRMEGLRFSANGYCRLAFYGSDKGFLAAVTGEEIAAAAAFSGRFTQNSSGHYTCIDLTAFEAARETDIVFFRLSAYAIDDSAVLTVNEEIGYTTVPGPVELIDLALDEQIAVPLALENRDAISSLELRLQALEARLGTG